MLQKKKPHNKKLKLRPTWFPQAEPRQAGMTWWGAATPRRLCSGSAHFRVVGDIAVLQEERLGFLLSLIAAALPSADLEAVWGRCTPSEPGSIAMARAGWFSQKSLGPWLQPPHTQSARFPQRLRGCTPPVWGLRQHEWGCSRGCAGSACSARIT